MQRRPSHPHGQLTGLIVLISMMLSVGIMFWLPGQPQQPAHAAAVATTGTASLPITRTPRAERGPVANSGELPAPTMDWSQIPTAIPADQLVAEALAATAAAQPPTPAPIIVHAQPEVVYNTPETVYIPAEPVVIVDTPVVVTIHVAPVATIIPDVVRNQDFAAPAPPSCQFVGALSCPQP